MTKCSDKIYILYEYQHIPLFVNYYFLIGKDIHFKNFYLNEKSGVAFEGDVTLTTDKDTFTVANVGTNKTLANFDVAFVGQVAKGDVKLRDLEKFWDAQGRFLITDPQTLTITQGSGKQTKITLYANDTLNDVAKKLNEAIGSGLGQNKYMDNANNFAKIGRAHV